MELFRNFIFEYLRNNYPYLFYLLNSENGIVYLVVFVVVAVMLSLLILFLIDTFLGGKDIIKFIKYKKACDLEIKKNTDYNYLFIEKKSFLKSLFIIAMLVLFVIFSLSFISFITLKIGRIVQTLSISFNAYIIALVFIVIFVTILYSLSIYWFAKLIIKIISHINEKYVQFVRPSFRIKKAKRRRKKYD